MGVPGAQNTTAGGGDHCIRVEKNMLKGNQPAIRYFGRHLLFLKPSTTLTMVRNPVSSVSPVTPEICLQSRQRRYRKRQQFVRQVGQRQPPPPPAVTPRSCSPSQRTPHGASRRNESSPSKKPNKNKIKRRVCKIQGKARLRARALRKQDGFKAPGGAASSHTPWGWDPPGSVWLLLAHSTATSHL